MKCYLFLFAVLFIVMALVPLLSLRLRENALLDSNEAPLSVVSKADTPAAQDATPPAKTQETPSSAAVETVLPISDIASLEEPVLLLDAGTGQVIKMSQREYVLGAVCSEMPPQFHIEAIKSQAIAAHSYLLRCKEQEKSQNPSPALKGAYLEVDIQSRSGYVSQATAKEMYGDRFDLYYPTIRDAVAQVEDFILIYDSQPIVAAYHAISAGKTENASNVWTGSADYLVSVESPGDLLAPNYETVETFSLTETRDTLKKAFPTLTLSEDPSTWFEDVARSDSGYITELRMGNTNISGQILRNLFKQRSSNLKITYKNNLFTFKASGYGHGVGMSQYGADYMGRQGADYQTILAHYYPGAALVKIK